MRHFTQNMDTVTTSDKAAIGLHTVTTMVTDEFLKAADRFGVTPELLLSLAARQFMDNDPKEINVISALPLDSQKCEQCSLASKCSSAIRRAREKLICFENLTAAVGVIAAVLTLFAPHHRTTAVASRNLVEPPPLREPATMPDPRDNYLKPKLRRKFAKKRKRRKQVVRDSSPILLAWNSVVRAGYRNASQ